MSALRPDAPLGQPSGLLTSLIKHESAQHRADMRKIQLNLAATV
jgi:hypothetical protein